MKSCFSLPYLFFAVIVANIFTITANADEFLVAQEGKSYLEEIDEQLVIHLKGSHKEIGFAHGKLLSGKVRENIQAFLYDFAIDERKHTMKELLELYAKAEPFIPKEFIEEMEGLAEGSGVPLDEVKAVHIIPEIYHCSGAALFGKATKDGKLYHYRSLDYNIEIGKKKRIQENALLFVYEPEGEISHIAVGWAGTIGCVTGMNAKKISVGEMGSSSSDESFEGIPMWLLLRQVIAKASSLTEALNIVQKGPRTCGYNFIFADGNIPDAAAVEVTRSKVEVFKPGDPKENVEPHFAIEDCVRRVNHFVSPEMAKTQREIYDPRVSESGSWLGYQLLSAFIKENYGKFDEEMMIKLCKSYPPEHPCLHQAVFCPTDLKLWVANAKDPKKEKLPGAQNQKFYPYDLSELLKKDPSKLKKREPLQK